MKKEKKRIIQEKKNFEKFTKEMKKKNLKKFDKISKIEKKLRNKGNLKKNGKLYHIGGVDKENEVGNVQNGKGEVGIIRKGIKEGVVGWGDVRIRRKVLEEIGNGF